MKHVNYLMIPLLLLLLTTSGRGKKIPNEAFRIIEGTLADQKKYPFIASLQYYGNHLCGGSIISDTVILTAAHCCFGPLDKHFKTKDLSVAVGSSKWKTSRKLKVSRLISHKRYNPDELTNDIALWVLKHKMTEKDGVDLVKLHWAPVNEHSKQVQATVLGWGMTSKNGLLIEVASDDLYMVDIHSVTIGECRNYYDSIGSGNICFSSPDSRGSCSGDSGGPLVMRKHSELVQIGLVSYGGDCNNTKPEVYTRISAYRSWIKKNVMKARKNKKRKRKY